MPEGLLLFSWTDRTISLGGMKGFHCAYMLFEDEGAQSVILEVQDWRRCFSFMLWVNFQFIASFQTVNGSFCKHMTTMFN